MRGLVLREIIIIGFVQMSLRARDVLDRIDRMVGLVATYVVAGYYLYCMIHIIASVSIYVPTR